jgi:hypothetical protein
MILVKATAESEAGVMRRFPNPAGAGKMAAIEVRQLFELEDFEPNEALERFRELEARERS